MSRKDMFTRTVLISIVMCLGGIGTAQALEGSYEEALQVRYYLEVDAPTPQTVSVAATQSTGVAETILLPVSGGFNQMSTGLCWAYATLNALETIYLVRNPEGLDVELSRRAMQYYQMEDRYRRSIKKVNTYLSEGGVVLDAIRLVQSNGIVSFHDYSDVTDPYGNADIRAMISDAGTPTQKLVAMYEGMDLVYTAPPTLTHMPGIPTVDNPDPTYEEVEAGDLARLVLAGDVWQSYTPSETKVGFHDHPDPDARWENLSWHMPRSEFPGRIKQALEAGFPVVVSIQNHGVLIYGADYDDSGSAITYYIKDSHETPRIFDGSFIWGYYYQSSAERLHESFWEMTTVKL